MLSFTRNLCCFARLATEAAAQFKEEVESWRSTAEADATAEAAPAPSPSALWIDDAAEAQQQQQAHVTSAAYRELHRPALTTSAMGLFGGEPGFEKAHRVWVDPDRPHMKHIYNQTALAKNLRYSRYGYFKRDMQLLDVDKLIRHARMLPTPNRVLTDFLYQRVPLPDRSCAALLRYQRDQLEMLDAWDRPASFGCAEEMFERMCVTNIPPVEVGVGTHAEMIRCCAVCGHWEKGWSVYFQRARELEEEDPLGEFVLDTDLLDAVLQLCVACERPQEGLAVVREVIARHLRPRPSILDRALLLVSIAAEQQQAAGTAPSPLDDEARLRAQELHTKQGTDLWALYDFYELRRTVKSVEAYARMCSLLDRPTLVLEGVSVSDAAHIPLSLGCYHWLLYAIRHVPNFGDYVMDVFAQLGPRGLSADYLLYTLAFGYCAEQRDGELALAVYQQHYTHADVNPTPELVLFFLQACARSADPTTAMLAAADVLVGRLEQIGSVEDRYAAIYDQYMELAAHVGAVATAYSKLKKLVGLGKGLTTRQLNSLLFAVSNAREDAGAAAPMVDEVIGLFRLMRIAANDDTIAALECCAAAAPLSAETVAFAEALLEQRAAAPEQTLGADAELPVQLVPPHRMRQLRTEWNLRPRDSVLRRYGQHTKPKPEVQVGSMLGSVVPFGRSPGEQHI
ncbi:hypothetical protein STCU_01428 [Strigomonas culicis]|uniref:Uncharacterized protein n=1 Tax=Strigomonas culicis TaxID=28005 RepID=S9V0Z6_9TRYP|nr:hypothetical protein STCU_01428 [Strigomonas culicis]|eukprot:EPY34674.1 hypothetical protein STCU_01428 [Strigomonas culicis]